MIKSNLIFEKSPPLSRKSNLIIKRSHRQLKNRRDSKKVDSTQILKKRRDLQKNNFCIKKYSVIKKVGKWSKPPPQNRDRQKSTNKSPNLHFHPQHPTHIFNTMILTFFTFLGAPIKQPFTRHTITKKIWFFIFNLNIKASPPNSHLAHLQYLQ